MTYVWQEPGPGFVGKRYLLCSDGVWHLVLRVFDDLTADTQCCEDLKMVYPAPDGHDGPMCQTCVGIHFGPKAVKAMNKHA